MERTRIPAELRLRLKETAARLEITPELYRQFGPWWWEVKRQLRTLPGLPRAVWYRGPCTDEAAWAAISTGEAAADLEAAFAHYDLWDDGPAWIERAEAGTCLVTWRSGATELYRVADTDTGHQLDLFENAERQDRRNRRFIEQVAEFLPRTWRQRGDTAQTEGRLDRASVCYQRMLHLAASSAERSEAWLLLGLLHETLNQPDAAIFCYRSLYARDNQHWVLGYIASCCRQAGRLRDAIDYYEQALRFMPGNPEWLAGLEAARIALASRPHLDLPPPGPQLELAHA